MLAMPPGSEWLTLASAVGDFIAVRNFASEPQIVLRTRWILEQIDASIGNGASSEFEVSRKVMSLHATIKELEDEP